MPSQLDQAESEQSALRRDMPTQARAAVLVPASYREADNSLEVRWTTGARRRAYDWWTGEFYDEELEVTPEAVDMSRFEAGVVQAIDSHRTRDGVAAILGIAIEGRIENGEGIARLALSSDPAKAGTVGDIRGGIIRAMSFGYSVQRYEVTQPKARTDGGTVPLYRATRWTPLELTFCPVGADPGAAPRAEGAMQTRSLPAGGSPCEFVTRSQSTQQEHHMPQISDDAAATGASQTAPADVAESARQAEAARSATITELCTLHGAPQLAARLIREGSTVDAARAALLSEIALRDAAAGGHTNVRGVHTVSDETETRLRGMEQAILHRCDARSALGDNGRQYRGMSLLEMGREHLERQGANTRGMTRLELATQIMHFRSGGMLSTSDFASLLLNVQNKRLRQAYEENPPSYQRWARRAPNAPDFKQMSVINLGAAPDLLKVNEHGEFKYGSMTDGKEVYSMLTYGRIVAFTRQALVNDDLRGFDRLIGAFGNSAARLENRIVYSIITTNAALSDSVALFHATHANLAGSGAAIDLTTLGAGRAAMRKQKGLQSEELNITPSFLIVPATIEQVAYQYTSPNYQPVTAGTVNEFARGGRASLEVVVEAVLDAHSTTAWYLAASNGAVDTIEYCFLDGAEGPVIESEPGFEVDGISFKCREDFAAKAIDFRGLYKNAGA